MEKKTRPKAFRLYAQPGGAWLLKQSHFWPDYKATANLVDDALKASGFAIRHRRGSSVWEITVLTKQDVGRLAEFALLLKRRLKLSGLKVSLVVSPGLAVALRRKKNEAAQKAEPTLSSVIADTQLAISKLEQELVAKRSFLSQLFLAELRGHLAKG